MRGVLRRAIGNLLRIHYGRPHTKIPTLPVATTDSDHDEPIFPNLAADMAPDGPNQLWVADITYVAIATGFVYLAAILDAWSRRVVGYAISRSIDARLTIAALNAAVRSRAPPAGCVHHSDRGSQPGFKRSSQHGLCWLIEASGQAPLRAFSSQASFGVWH